MKGHYTVIKTLLGWMNIDQSARNNYNSTPLHEATAQGHLQVVKLLLSEPSIDINARDIDVATSLW